VEPTTEREGERQRVYYSMLLRTYNDWAFRTKAKVQAGMKYSKVTPFSPAKGAAAGSD
jgi:hypothetical protein